jgi:predicted DNA-binding helix-hairpin-helix protein
MSAKALRCSYLPPCSQLKAQQIAALTLEKADWLARQQQLENEKLSLEAQRDDLKLHVDGKACWFVCN